MNIITGLRKYLTEFPELEGSNISADFTEQTPVSYSISPTGDNNISEYMDGSNERITSIALAMRQYANEDNIRIDNHDFLQKLSMWIRKQELIGRYPNIGDRLVVTEIGCDNPVLMDVNEAGDAGLYQIQIYIKYLEGV